MRAVWALGLALVLGWAGRTCAAASPFETTTKSPLEENCSEKTYNLNTCYCDLRDRCLDHIYSTLDLTSCPYCDRKPVPVVVTPKSIDFGDMFAAPAPPEDADKYQEYVEARLKELEELEAPEEEQTTTEEMSNSGLASTAGPFMAIESSRCKARIPYGLILRAVGDAADAEDDGTEEQNVTINAMEEDTYSSRRCCCPFDEDTEGQTFLIHLDIDPETEFRWKKSFKDYDRAETSSVISMATSDIKLFLEHIIAEDDMYSFSWNTIFRGFPATVRLEFQVSLKQIRAGNADTILENLKMAVNMSNQAEAMTSYYRYDVNTISVEEIFPNENLESTTEEAVVETTVPPETDTDMTIIRPTTLALAALTFVIVFVMMCAFKTICYFRGWC